MRVQDIMTKDVSYCSPGTNAAAASEIMWARNCGVLPIVEGGRVVGMITDRDLFIALGTSNRNAAGLCVGEIMNKDLSSCEPTDDVSAVLKTMAQRQVHRLPVVDKDGVLKGILSMDDIVLRAEAGGLTNDEVIKAIMAISDRQNQRKESQPQPSEPRRAVA